MKKLTVVIILFLVVSVIAGIWWFHGTSAVNPQDKSSKIFVVQKGEPLREIANRLKEQKLITDPIIFFLLVKQNNLDNKIQAGDFRLSPSQSALSLAESMTKGTLDVWITVPEGYRANEIATTLNEKFPQYRPTWQTTLQQYEGYLFPDTYLLPKDTTVEQIISVMKRNFTEKYAALQKRPTQTYTEQQIVTIASLVEREARFADDRPLVASVIYNRLSSGMPLQIDATIQYILGYQPSEKSWWKKNLTTDDLALSSPYNTYKNVGLPPTPIANPGESALQAALMPTQTDYIYYVSDKDGHNHYAKTLQEHNANIKKYGL